MNVPLVNVGDPIRAAEMNALVGELDRKTDLALDGHSILFLLGENADQTRRNFAPYLGETFTWCNGPQRISGYWGTWSYDSSVFNTALAFAVPMTSPNVGQGGPSPAPAGGWPISHNTGKWLRINPLPEGFFTQIGKLKNNFNRGDYRDTTSLLRFSLETHRINYDSGSGVEPHWVWETFSSVSDTNGFNAFPVHLQRKKYFDQAELIFDGAPGITFQRRWNKYRFFRIHNLNSAPINVRFEGSPDLDLTVPAYGSQCVRRILNGDGTSTFELGYKHFQKWGSGDVPVYQRTGANNIYNPSLLIPFVNHVLAGRTFTTAQNPATPIRFAAPTVLLDPHVRAPLPTPTAAKYGSIGADNAVPPDGKLLGDCLHHRGNIKEVDAAMPAVATLSFDGYGSIGSIVSTQRVGDDLQIKSSVNRDLLAVSTNLFCTGVGLSHIAHPVIDGSAWLTLDRHTPAQGNWSVVSTATPSQVSYIDANGFADFKTITRASLSFAVPADTAALRPHDHTVFHAKQKYCAQHASALATFHTSTLMTSGGFVILTTQTIPLDAPFTDAIGDLPNEASQLARNIITRGFDYYRDPSFADLGIALNDFDIVANTLTIKRAVVFTDYGWPDVDTWFYTGVFTPRLVRNYSDCPRNGRVVNGTPSAGPKPNFAEGANGELASGNEVEWIGDAAGTPTEIALLSPWKSFDYTHPVSLGSPIGTVGMLNNNDVILGALKGVLTPGYWTANRARLLANQIHYNSEHDGSDGRRIGFTPLAGGFYRFWRRPMSAEDYGNLAAKVNSMVRYKPLNWIDHGVVQNGNDQTRRYRLKTNTTGIFEKIAGSSTFVGNAWFRSLNGATQQTYLKRIKQLRGMRPVRQYCAFDFDETDANYLIAGYAGLPIKTVSDLPDDFGTHRTAPAELSDIIMTGTVSFLDNPETFGAGGLNELRVHHYHSIGLNNLYFALRPAEITGPARPDFNGLTKYLWLSVDDVKAYAEALGYEFIHAAIGVGYDFTMQRVEAGLLGALQASPGAQLAIDRGTPGFDVFEDRFGNTRPLLPALVSPINFQVNCARVLSLYPTFVPGTHWIAGDGSPLQVQTMDWADTFRFRIGGVAVLREARQDGVFGDYVAQSAAVLRFGGANSYFAIPVNIPETFRRVHYGAFLDAGLEWPATARNPGDYTNEFICREALVVKELSAGVPDASEQVLIDVPWLEFTPNYSSTPANAEFRERHGPSVYPFTVREEGANRVHLWADFTEPL